MMSEMADRRRSLVVIYICVNCLLITNLVLNESAVTVYGSLSSAADEFIRHPPVAEYAQITDNPSDRPPKHTAPVESWTKSYTRLKRKQYPFALGVATAKETSFNRGKETSDTSLAMSTKHSQIADHVPSTAFGKLFRVAVTPNEEDSVDEVFSKGFQNILLHSQPQQHAEDTAQPGPAAAHIDANGNTMADNDLDTKGEMGDGLAFNLAIDLQPNPRVEGCPSTCQCIRKASGVDVKCTSHLWKEVPPLPQDVKQFTWESPKAPVVIQNDSFSGTYIQLDEIDLRKAEFQYIGGRAFENIIKLKRIYFRNNKIKSLPNDSNERKVTTYINK